MKPKSKFHANSATTYLEGEILLKLHNVEEKYEVEFPAVLARGLLFGTQCLELYEHLKMRCEKTGYSADIEFVSKVYLIFYFIFLQVTNGAEGVVKKGSQELYKISGVINEKLVISSIATKKAISMCLFCVITCKM